MQPKEKEKEKKHQRNIENNTELKQTTKYNEVNKCGRGERNKMENIICEEDFEYFRQISTSKYSSHFQNNIWEQNKKQNNENDDTKPKKKWQEIHVEAGIMI